MEEGAHSMRRAQESVPAAQGSEQQELETWDSILCLPQMYGLQLTGKAGIPRSSVQNIGVALQVTVYWENGKENGNCYNYGGYTVVCISDKYLSGPAASERRAGGAGAAGRRGPLFFAFVRCFQVRCFPKLGGTLVLGLPYIRVTVSGSILGSPYLFGKVRFAF